METLLSEHNFKMALALFDLIGGVLIFCALMTQTMIGMPKWVRLFIALGGAGLLAQSGMTYARINEIDVAHLWWSWALKDFCIGGMAIGYMVLRPRIRVDQPRIA